MQKYHIATVIFLFCGLLLHAQPTPLTGTFKLSSDDSTGTFLQDRPYTTVSDSLSFFVSWRDARSYPGSTFGVRLNSLGEPETPNFSFKKMWDGQYIAPFEKRYLSLSRSTQTLGPTTQYNFSGTLVSANGMVRSNFPITVLSIGDVVFNPGIFFSSFTKNKKLYLFASMQEQTNLSIIDSNGVVISRKDTSHSAIIGLTSARNNAGEFLTVRLNYDDNTIKADFYSASDSLIVRNKAILKLPRLLYPYGTSPILILPTKENNFLIALQYVDTFYTVLISPSGEAIGNTGKYLFRAETEENYWRPINFFLTNLKNGKADVFATVINNRYPRVLRTKIFSFSEFGTLTDTIGTYNFTDTLNGGIFKTGTNNYLTAVYSNGDIYLKEINNFADTLVRKLNDDLNGSNDLNGQVIGGTNGRLFAVWESGNKTFVQSFSSDGVLHNNKVWAPSSSVFGHLDGSLRFLSLRTNGLVLIHKYNSGLQPIAIDTLRSSEGIIQNAVNYTGKTLPDSNILYMASTSSVTHVVLTTPEGVLLASDTINATSANANYPAIFIADDVSVYVSVGYAARKYLFSLARIGETGYTSGGVYTAGHIFGNAFVFLNANYQAQYVLDMRRTDGTYAVNKKVIGSFPLLDFQNHVSYNRFGLFTEQQNGSLQYRVFDTTGNDVITPLTIEPTGPYFDRISFSVAENKIFFLWSDNRNGNADVFCKIYPLAPLVGVKEQPGTTTPTEYTLSAVYPNPFNPTSKVRFTLPSEGNIRLVVYNTLGEQITVLHSGSLQPGVYEKEFSAHTLPGGVYFFRLDYASGSLVSKALLIK